LDANIETSQLNTINFNNVDQRTASVAVVHQGVDAAGQLMAAQQQALQTEANALHSVVMERQRETLVSEARDRLTSIEQRAADEISQKNLLLNDLSWSPSSSSSPTTDSESSFARKVRKALEHSR